MCNNRVPTTQGNQGKPGKNFLLRENLENSGKILDFTWSQGKLREEFFYLASEKFTHIFNPYAFLLHLT